MVIVYERNVGRYCRSSFANSRVVFSVRLVAALQKLEQNSNGRVSWEQGSRASSGELCACVRAGFDVREFRCDVVHGSDCLLVWHVLWRWAGFFFYGAFDGVRGY